MNVKERIIGELDCLHIPGDKNGAAIVLLHGYGANAQDLFPLHKAIETYPGTHWFFPQGPLELGKYGNFTSRAWFPLGVADSILQAVETGNWTKVASLNPKGLDTARGLLVQFLKEIGIPYSKVILGGFSQGAMLALDTFLTLEEKPLGLTILSGTVLKENKWVELAAHKTGFQFIQSHGMVDDLLPFAAAKRLEALLFSAGLKGEFIQFPGGHDIPEVVVRKVSNYIMSRNYNAPK
jgi:phospholipase/carboxylesterase